MKILITGARGFLGKNLIARLQQLSEDYQIYSYDLGSTADELAKYCTDCDFVFNFAAVHRPNDTAEFRAVNYSFFEDLLKELESHGNCVPVVYTSSIQAGNGTEYGNSKLAAEAALVEYGTRTGARTILYRLTNTFGRWAMPNHHSVVATFCNNLVHGTPIQVSDRAHVMEFYYVDDVIDSFVSQIEGEQHPDSDGIFRLPADRVFKVTLGELADILIDISRCVERKEEYLCNTELKSKLYITYLSYYEGKGKE